MNKKMYINNEGVKVKPCARCKNDFPCTEEYYPIKPNGNCYAYCWDCKKESDKEYGRAHRKTSARRTKNIPFVEDGVEYKKCGSCQGIFPHTKKYFDPNKNGQGGLNYRCKECRRGYNRSVMEKRWAWHLFHNARGSARRYGLEMDIDEQYVLDLYKKQNGKCYWLGIELIPSSAPKSLSQPSLDRIDRTRGYVQGNVVLCSFFANFGRNENEEPVWKKFLLSMKNMLDFGMWNER